MKTDTVFKQAYNATLDLIGGLKKGASLPSENDLSAELAVSRTTVRKVLSELGYLRDEKSGALIRPRRVENKTRKTKS